MIGKGVAHRVWFHAPRDLGALAEAPDQSPERLFR
jgi:hypothetical protein